MDSFRSCKKFRPSIFSSFIEPVVISTHDIEILPFDEKTLNKLLLFFESSNESSIIVPGVIILTTSLLKILGLSFKLSSFWSSCSATATLNPNLINLDKYVCDE